MSSIGEHKQVFKAEWVDKPSLNHNQPSDKEPCKISDVCFYISYLKTVSLSPTQTVECVFFQEVPSVTADCTTASTSGSCGPWSEGFNLT